MTIFTLPKPFKGHIDIIQRNALKSWTKLGQGCEIILFGDDEGVGEAACEFGVKHISVIEKNEYGTPLLGLAFEKAQKMAQNNTMCYVNADIMLMRDILSAIKQIRFEKYLMIGQRWDVNINKSWEFNGNAWEKKLRAYVFEKGEIHPPSGSDYFVYRKGILDRFPPFAVGRPGWDNWVIYHARKRRIPVIDSTQMVTVVHQKHDYRHIIGGSGEDHWGPEGDNNITLMGGWGSVFTLRDANWRLSSKGVARCKWTIQRFRRFLWTLPVLYSLFSLFTFMAGFVRKGVAKDNKQFKKLLNILALFPF